MKSSRMSNTIFVTILISPYTAINSRQLQGILCPIYIDFLPRQWELVVALAAGYQTHAAFGKAFKQQYGLSPSDFRDLTCREATQRLMKGLES